jgi:hypothetical protein
MAAAPVGRVSRNYEPSLATSSPSSRQCQNNYCKIKKNSGKFSKKNMLGCLV